MGKAPVMKENVIWTTGYDKDSNYCVGYFSEDVDRSFIIKETNNAPIDFETLESRTSLNKQRKSIVNNPSNKGYSEQYVLIVTPKVLDNDDLNEIQLPFVESYKDIKNLPIEMSLNIGKNSTIKINEKSVAYKFRTTFEENKMVG